MAWPREHDEEPRYLGLTATQFNLAFFALVGGIALIVWLVAFGGTSHLGLGKAEQDTAVQTTTPIPATTGTELALPRFIETRCAFSKPELREVRCGNLVVLEDRSQPEGGTVTLHVAIFKSDSESPAPDPIVYLEGGPGASALKAMPFVLTQFEPLLADRDVIVLDQRGVGYSQPSLTCPEVNEALNKTLRERLSTSAETALFMEALGQCHGRLTEGGVNLAAYNSAESAADVNDLRQALGYEQWNLLGVSYGTRLALTVMRDYPQGIRSVILDSTYPPQVDLYAEMPANLMRALRLLFDGCAADPYCNSNFPQLESVLFELVRQLNENPISVSLTHPLTFERFPNVAVDGTDLLEFLFNALYDSSLIPSLPAVIYGIGYGDYSTLAYVMQSQLEEYGFFSNGMYMSVQCTEEVPFSSREAVSAALDAYPQIRDVFVDPGSGTTIFDACASWGAPGAEPIENQPVNSDIPTLILAGEYDPITPPAWGQLAAQGLSHSFYFEFPGYAHGVGFAGECPLRLIQDFLRDPASQPGCA